MSPDFVITRPLLWCKCRFSSFMPKAFRKHVKLGCWIDAVSGHVAEILNIYNQASANFSTIFLCLYSYEKRLYWAGGWNADHRGTWHNQSNSDQMLNCHFCSNTHLPLHPLCPLLRTIHRYSLLSPTSCFWEERGIVAKWEPSNWNPTFRTPGILHSRSGTSEFLGIT